MMGETRAAKRAGFNQEPRGDHPGTRGDRRDPSASPAGGGLFNRWRAHTLHMSEAAELSRGGIAEGRVLVDCWVGVSGRGPPWELLSSWQE